jgi:transposase
VEASTSAEWVARHLESLGHGVVVADPRVRLMYAAGDKKIKTDRREARALAVALRVGAYRRAHRKSDEARALALKVSARRGRAR